MLNRARMTAAKLVHAKREQVLSLAKEHGAYNVRIFGSIARGDDREDSDIDLLIDFESDRSLLDYVGLQQDLQELLGKRVELAQPTALHPLIRDQILDEAQAL